MVEAHFTKSSIWLKTFARGVSDIKGVGAEDNQGVRLVWQNEIRFIMFLHYLQRAILLKHIFLIYVYNKGRLKSLPFLGLYHLLNSKGEIKMKDMVFKGVATAIVTPFNREGIDFKSFSKLIEWQIEEGVNAILVCGTTGESSTMSDEEHKQAMKFVVEQVNGRVPVIAGTGSNDIAYGDRKSVV